VRLGCPQSSALGRNKSARECGSGWGNHVVVHHGHGVYVRYAHLDPRGVTVGVGDQVRRGDRLGLMGNSGRSETRHLHFELGTRAGGFDPTAPSQSFDAVYDPEQLPLR
jgi:murein DD-endopeptidase MepM/ murein hydrolase activator NlpD